MLRIDCRKMIKSVTFEGYSETEPLEITFTAEKLLGTCTLEVQVHMCDPEESVSLCVATYMTQKVPFDELALERYALEILEEYGDKLLEDYHLRMTEYFGV